MYERDDAFSPADALVEDVLERTYSSMRTHIYEQYEDTYIRASSMRTHVYVLERLSYCKLNITV